MRNSAYLTGLLAEVRVVGLDISRRLQVLRSLAELPQTRQQLAKRLQLRPATITQTVAELMRSGLLRESDTITTNTPGRPGTTLVPVPEAINCIVIRVVSDTFVGTVVDLQGKTSFTITRRVDAERIDADGIETLLSEMAMALLLTTPRERVAGVSFSLPGIINGEELLWSFSGRFQRADGIKLSRLRERIGVDITVHRPLTAELNARMLIDSAERTGVVAILHWGFGISLSVAKDGRTFAADNTAFGEVGHWNVDTGSPDLCRCGKYGCLETRAALWALSAHLGIKELEEDRFGQILKEDGKLATHPVMHGAIEHIARALQHIHLMLFPARIVVTGPFVQNRNIADRLQTTFQALIPTSVPAGAEIVAAESSEDDEVIGAAKTLLLDGLKSLL